jgi:DNA-binding transcriptional LysR family regulator
MTRSGLISLFMHGPNAKPAGRRGDGDLRRALAMTGQMFGVRQSEGLIEAAYPSPEATLRIGVCSSLSTGRLRDTLRAFRAAAPDTHVSVSIDLGTKLHREVVAGRLDLALVCDRVEPLFVEVEELWREPLFAVLPEGHRLAKDNVVDPASLNGETLLLCRRDLAAADSLLFKQLDTVPNLVINPVEADRETLFNLVALGFGIGFTSGSSLGVYYPGVAFKPILKAEKAVPYCALWMDNNANPELRAFLELARTPARKAGREPTR